MTRTILEAERIRAAELDAQILDLERSLSTLRAQKTLVQERLDSYKYPVLTLPNEIISEIFVHSLPVYPECPPLTGILSPTNLTHICQKWREVARNNHMLWRAIRLSFSTLPRQVQALDMYLDMSGCCPLSINTERSRNVVGGSVPEWASNILTILAPHRARWQHLRFDRFDLPHHRLSDFGHPMPLLRELDMSQFFEDESDPVLFGEAPLLRSVTLSGYVVNVLILPWAQLTSLTLRFVYRSECTPILQQTTNLVHCRLHLLPPQADNDAFEADIALPYLESFRLDPPSHANASVVETLIVPALRSLEIPEKCLGVNPIDTLTSFISKSGCKPGKIFITGPRIFLRDTYSRAFPSVSFTFEGRCVGEALNEGISSNHDVEM